MHCWITLGNMQIVDFTLPSSLAIRYDDYRNAFGRIITKHPHMMTAGLNYHPKVVGEKALNRINEAVINARL